MKYITGIYGLNIPNSKETCGDWHSTSLDWDSITFLESNDSIWGDWGIERDKPIAFKCGKFNVADDMRSILDLMGVYNKLAYLKGFRNDFLCTDKYNQEFFDKVYMLRNRPNWSDINSLMRSEFMWEWVDYLKKRGLA